MHVLINIGIDVGLKLEVQLLLQGGDILVGDRGGGTSATTGRGGRIGDGYFYAGKRWIGVLNFGQGLLGNSVDAAGSDVATGASNLRLDRRQVGIGAARKH